MPEVALPATTYHALVEALMIEARAANARVLALQNQVATLEAENAPLRAGVDAQARRQAVIDAMRPRDDE